PCFVRAVASSQTRRSNGTGRFSTTIRIRARLLDMLPHGSAPVLLREDEAQGWWRDATAERVRRGLPAYTPAAGVRSHVNTSPMAVPFHPDEGSSTARPEDRSGPDPPHPLFRPRRPSVSRRCLDP